MAFELPSLPYAYDALEPHIDAKTMEIHHSKHHQAYVTNLNKALAGTKLATFSLNQLLMDASFRSDAIRNNAGGHYNHSLFWEIYNMTQEINYDCEIISKMFKPIGNIVLVKASIWQELSTFKKLIDTIELTIEGGMAMEDYQLKNEILDVYKASLT